MERRIDFSDIRQTIASVKSKIKQNKENHPSELMKRYQELESENEQLREEYNSYKQEPSADSMIKELQDQVERLLVNEESMVSEIETAKSKILSLEKKICNSQDVLRLQSEKINKDFKDLKEFMMSAETSKSTDRSFESLTFGQNKKDTSVVYITGSDILMDQLIIQLDTLERDKIQVENEIRSIPESSRSIMNKRKRQALEIELSMVNSKIVSVQNKIKKASCK